MTEVWFYVSDDQRPDGRARLLLRLLERALSSGRQLCLLSKDDDSASRLDDWLWREADFIPHGRCDGDRDKGQPVLICSPEQLPAEVDVLVNLATELPAATVRARRLIELVAGDASARATGRQHWQSYRDRGYSVVKHELP